MRSMLVSSLHLVLFPRNQPYMLIFMGVLILYQVWLRKLYLILANIALFITTSMSFLLSNYPKPSCSYAWSVILTRKTTSCFMPNINVHALYCLTSKSTSFVCSFKTFASKTLYEAEFCLCIHTLKSLSSIRVHHTFRHVVFHRHS